MPSVASEGCLFVNMWTPRRNTTELKAVMIWIYSGGFSMGDSSTEVYNGARFAHNQNVVAVSLNYRTNVFGFPTGPPGLRDLNPGLLDQRLAVEWTKRNIEGFGGDPERMVLWGESAGASSVDYYAFAWAEGDPLVQGFIA